MAIRKVSVGIIAVLLMLVQPTYAITKESYTKCNLGTINSPKKFCLQVNPYFNHPDAIYYTKGIFTEEEKKEGQKYISDFLKKYNPKSVRVTLKLQKNGKTIRTKKVTIKTNTKSLVVDSHLGDMYEHIEGYIYGNTKSKIKFKLKKGTYKLVSTGKASNSKVKVVKEVSKIKVNGKGKIDVL